MKGAVPVGSLLILLAGCSESPPAASRAESTAVLADASQLMLVDGYCLDQGADTHPWTVTDRHDGGLALQASPADLGLQATDPGSWAEDGIDAWVSVGASGAPLIYPVASFERIALNISERRSFAAGVVVEGGGWNLVQYSPGADLIDGLNRVQCSQSGEGVAPEQSFVRCLSSDEERTRAYGLQMSSDRIPDLPTILTSVRSVVDKLTTACGR